MVKRNDFILIGAVILLCLVVFIMINSSKKEGSRVVATVDGKEYKTFLLNQDTKFTIEGKNGSYNTFEIKNGSAHMIDASCPDKLCMKQGSIHYNHETIVCLPNKLVLEVKDGEDDNVDMIVH